MRKLNFILLLAGAAGFLVAQGQNTLPAATPQTGGAAPAATSPASTGAQAAEAGAARSSAARGSRGASQPNTAGSPGQTGNSDTPGITGVPRYRAGFRGSKSKPAKAATASITVTGESDGAGNVTGAPSAVLPGIPQMHNAFGIAKGTPIQVKLGQPVDSGHAKNGDTVHGVLAAAIAGIPAGAPVQLTVVAVAAAGQMSSNGELSLQVVSVDGQRVLSDVITAEGKEGEKLLPDDAPGRGTEAIFPADQPITLPAG